MFQSTRPCGARCPHAGRMLVCTYVSIHAPLRSAIRITDRGLIVNGLFQSTRPCGARYVPADAFAASGLFQSTRPCGARFSTFAAGRAADVAVSIHAPLRSAMRRAVCRGPELLFQSTRPCGARSAASDARTSAMMFQSTRPCGARWFFPVIHRGSPWFQSTRPCGARSLQTVEAFKVVEVSIHAPLRSAIGTQGAEPLLFGCFNPRAPAERDGKGFGACCTPWRFQSTRPCGARLNDVHAAAVGLAVSIHAPLRSAIIAAAHSPVLFGVSIHAPLRSAIRHRQGIQPCPDVSIHAPLRSAISFA